MTGSHNVDGGTDILLHNPVIVNTNIWKGCDAVARRAITEFGKQIKKRLVDLEQPQTWLIEQVKEKTGKYFDSSYLAKICAGTLTTPGIVGAIKEILSLEEWMEVNDENHQQTA